MTPSPEEYARLEALFSQALDLPPSERPAFLDKLRTEHGPALARDLERLLAASADQTIPMQAPAGLFSNRSFHDGELVLNRFRIVRELGHGGMGEVYEALDSDMGPVALKTIRGDIAFNSSLLLRFKQEVQLARMVTSQHVCRIHEFFTLPATNLRPPIAFLTMELLNGTTLADRVSKDGSLPWHDAEPIAFQLCQGLQAIHAARIIHRDFKPRNIMLATSNGALRAVIMDLGLAHQLQLADTSPSSRSLTIAGTVMGTQDYMAPEQFEDGPISPATDIYSFGIVLYEMVTGKLPFEAQSLIAAASRRAKRPATASSIQPSVPAHVSRVIEKCLAYDPAQRYQSTAELATALKHPFLNNIKPARPRLLLAGLLALVSLAIGYQTYRQWNAHHIPEPARHFYTDATSSFNKGNYLTASRQLKKSIERDPDFVLAHARLADAYNELDFTGEAQRELNQIKQDLVTQLPATDQTYIEAVRDTLRPDPASAITRYQKLLSKATSSDDKAAALTDLARANERAGNIPEAIKNYGQAIQLNPNSPAPYLRRGILQSRQGHQKEADTDFATADQIYTTDINLEGEAEIAYQRSYVASKLGPEHDAEARKFYQASMEAAKQMSSIPLQVRALSRLSAIEYSAMQDEEAANVANKAIALAEKNGIYYWATDARIRLANAWTDRDPAKATELLDRARLEAQHNQWPKLLALSQLSLASFAIEDLTRNRQLQVIDLAEPAFRYYETMGFAHDSLQCQILLTRATLFLGSLSESISHAEKAVKLASGLGSTDFFQAHEALGDAFLRKEDYPAALNNFETALRVAAAMPDGPLKNSFQLSETLLKCEALCRLGRLQDASLALASYPDSNWKGALKRTFIGLRAEMLNTRGAYRDALRVIKEESGPGASLRDYGWEMKLMSAEAMIHTGKINSAIALCDVTVLPGGAESFIITNHARLIKTRALLEAHQWTAASALATALANAFSTSGQKESELLSQSFLAAACCSVPTPLPEKWSIVETTTTGDIITISPNQSGQVVFQVTSSPDGIFTSVSSYTEPREYQCSARAGCNTINKIRIDSDTTPGHPWLCPPKQNGVCHVQLSN